MKEKETIEIIEILWYYDDTKARWKLKEGE